MNYKELMCSNCKECIGEKIIKYEIGTAQATKCENFYPKYGFDNKGASCPFFVAFSDEE